jgi:hypothetical protein
MKETKFYPTIWQTIPYSLDNIGNWDAEGRQIKDLTLNSKLASEFGVSEMNLNLIKFTAFDNEGVEHFITDFPPHTIVNLKGLHTGLFVKSKRVLDLPKGTYSSFRFHIEELGNRFTYSDRSSEPISGVSYLDFKIEDGLEISDGEASEIILRFDFEPYTLASYFKPFLQLFKKTKSFTTNLVNS